MQREEIAMPQRLYHWMDSAIQLEAHRRRIEKACSMLADIAFSRAAALPITPAVAFSNHFARAF
jgi:hypothetical protein